MISQKTWTAIQNFVYGLSGKKKLPLSDLSQYFTPCRINVKGQQLEMSILTFKPTKILFISHTQTLKTDPSFSFMRI
jgi:hypothetical protein